MPRCSCSRVLITQMGLVIRHTCTAHVRCQHCSWAFLPNATQPHKHVQQGSRCLQCEQGYSVIGIRAGAYYAACLGSRKQVQRRWE